MKLRGFRDLSFRHKLILMMMSVGSAAVMIVTLALVGFEWMQFRSSMVRELTTEAAMIGANSAAALAFDDATTGNEVLGVLRVRPEIVQAWLLRSGDQVFAQYARSPGLPVPLAWPEGHHFVEGHLVLCQPVKFGQETVGRICLRADMREQRWRLWGHAGIALVMMAVALLIAYWVAVRLQRVLSEPLVALTRAVGDVSKFKDYGLRVTKQGDDEIGVLIDGFNRMLVEIQKRDEEIGNREERFRQLTETIQEVFWLQDETEDRMLYVSPAYERIWGQRVEELYLRPSAWLDAIHPDDRGRVRQAMKRQHREGEYNEEYRVVRPDGAVRWVHDRSFPVRDADGNVHRIAGIAEDVTERKRLEREILEISEREQRRIGQDIHDGLCQQLVGIGFVAKLLENKLGQAGSPHLAEIREIGALLQQAVIQARNLSHGLSPVRLDKDGLELALHGLAGNIVSLFSINCEFDCPFPVRLADNTAATHLYRIAQEAVNNAIKHGQPGKITISLAQTGATLTLSVTDDGKGMAATSNQAKGIGLHVMRSRARMIGGNLDIRGRKQGQGTVLTCTCPIKE